MSLRRKFFGDPEDADTGLRRFTETYCKKKSIRLIGHGELMRWAKLTAQTGGKLTPKCMSPKLWGDSVESLQTGVAILVTSTPAELVGQEAIQRSVAALRVAILKSIKARKGSGIVLRKRSE